MAECERTACEDQGLLYLEYLNFSIFTGRTERSQMVVCTMLCLQLFNLNEPVVFEAQTPFQ